MLRTFLLFCVIIVLGLAFAFSMFDRNDSRNNHAEAAQLHMSMAGRQSDDMSDSFTALSPTTETTEGSIALTDDAISRAVALVATLEEANADVPTTEHQQAVADLKSKWMPRYQQAIADYDKMLYRIDIAYNATTEYLHIQKQLTAEINNPSLRAQQNDLDIIELRQFYAWESSVDRARATATEMKNAIEDMHRVILKEELRASFLNEHIYHIPDSLQDLHRDLNDFRDLSQAIAATFGPTS